MTSLKDAPRTHYGKTLKGPEGINTPFPVSLSPPSTPSFLVLACSSVVHVCICECVVFHILVLICALTPVLHTPTVSLETVCERMGVYTCMYTYAHTRKNSFKRTLTHTHTIKKREREREREIHAISTREWERSHRKCIISYTHKSTHTCTRTQGSMRSMQER